MCYIELALTATTVTLERRILPWQKKNNTCVFLARNLLSKLCANLFKLIEKKLRNQNFIARHRVSPKNFLRNRILSFQTIVLLLLNFFKGSYQDELDNFFKNIRGYKVARRVVSKSALTKARKKLKHEAFVELNDQQVDFFYENFTPLTWHGFQLAAFDGSTIRLPREEEIADHFGTWKVRQGEPSPMARLSQMFDPLNKVSLDALITPKSMGERELAALHCRLLQPDHLVLLDRGYPAFWLFKLILSRNAQFCARISITKWKVVRKFYRSGLRDKIVEIPSPSTSMAKCKELGLDIAPLRCRLVRVELDNGETEILITSLLDADAYPREEFQELYHCRWPVEEDYKVMKVWLTMENFSGKSVLSVYQDFHAKIFSKNLTSILAFPTREAIDQTYKDRTHRYKINFVQALSKTKQVIVLLLQRSYCQTMRLIDNLHDIFIQTVEAIRPGRKYPRNHKPSQRKFFQNYKPIC